MLVSTQLFLALVGLAAATPTPAILTKRAINCLTVGSTATARWTNSAGKTCTFTGTVGSNFGANPAGSGEYAYWILGWTHMLTVAAIPAMDDVEPAALELPWVTLTRKIVSLMTSAHTSTMQVAVRGVSSFIHLTI